MKIKKVISLLCTAAMLLAVPAGNVYAGAEDQSVVVTMPTTSDPVLIRLTDGEPESMFMSH